MDVALIAYAESKGLAPEGSFVDAIVRENRRAVDFATFLLDRLGTKRTWGECLWTARDLAYTPGNQIILG